MSHNQASPPSLPVQSTISGFKQTNVRISTRMFLHPSVVYLGLCGPRAQVPAAAALVVALVLDGYFAEMAKDVLHLGIASATALTAEVIQP